MHWLPVTDFRTRDTGWQHSHLQDKQQPCSLHSNSLLVMFCFTLFVHVSLKRTEFHTEQTHFRVVLTSVRDSATVVVLCRDTHMLVLFITGEQSGFLGS